MAMLADMLLVCFIHGGFETKPPENKGMHKRVVDER